MLFGVSSKNIKIKAVFFIVFFLWILMAEGKQGADSLGLRRNAGWNWPPCRLQAMGFRTTFSRLIHCCKFNVLLLEADRGRRDNTAQLPPPERPVQPIPRCFPWKCLSNAEQGWLTLEKFANATCPEAGCEAEGCAPHCSPVSGKQIWTTQGLGSTQHEKASRASSEPGSGGATTKVWSGIALATQEALSQSGKGKDLIFKGLCQLIKD